LHIRNYGQAFTWSIMDHLYSPLVIYLMFKGNWCTLCTRLCPSQQPPAFSAAAFLSLFCHHFHPLLPPFWHCPCALQPTIKICQHYHNIRHHKIFHNPLHPTSRRELPSEVCFQEEHCCSNPRWLIVMSMKWETSLVYISQTINSHKSLLEIPSHTNNHKSCILMFTRIQEHTTQTMGKFIPLSW